MLTFRVETRMTRPGGPNGVRWGEWEDTGMMFASPYGAEQLAKHLRSDSPRFCQARVVDEETGAQPAKSGVLTEAQWDVTDALWKHVHFVVPIDMGGPPGRSY